MTVKRDSLGLPDTNQLYKIPYTFAQVPHSSYHDRAIFSMWAHFVDMCRSSSGGFNDDKPMAVTNAHICDIMRLPVFISLSVLWSQRVLLEDIDRNFDRRFADDSPQQFSEYNDDGNCLQVRSTTSVLHMNPLLLIMHNITFLFCRVAKLQYGRRPFNLDNFAGDDFDDDDDDSCSTYPQFTYQQSGDLETVNTFRLQEFAGLSSHAPSFVPSLTQSQSSTTAFSTHPSHIPAYASSRVPSIVQSWIPSLSPLPHYMHSYQTNKDVSPDALPLQAPDSPSPFHDLPSPKPRLSDHFPSAESSELLKIYTAKILSATPRRPRASSHPSYSYFPSVPESSNRPPGASEFSTGVGSVFTFRDPITPRGRLALGSKLEESSRCRPQSAPQALGSMDNIVDGLLSSKVCLTSTCSGDYVDNHRQQHILIEEYKRSPSPHSPLTSSSDEYEYTATLSCTAPATCDSVPSFAKPPPLVIHPYNAPPMPLLSPLSPYDGSPFPQTPCRLHGYHRMGVRSTTCSCICDRPRLWPQAKAWKGQLHLEPMLQARSDCHEYDGHVYIGQYPDVPDAYHWEKRSSTPCGGLHEGLRIGGSTRVSCLVSNGMSVTLSPRSRLLWSGQADGACMEATRNSSFPTAFDSPVYLLDSTAGYGKVEVPHDHSCLQNREITAASPKRAAVTGTAATSGAEAGREGSGTEVTLEQKTQYFARTPRPLARVRYVTSDCADTTRNRVQDGMFGLPAGNESVDHFGLDCMHWTSPVGYIGPHP